MTNKLLVMCGPTATGKTSLGILLAKKFNGEIVSADSRQVYKNMDIGTGKDLPANSKFQTLNSKLEFRNSDLGFYLIQGIRLWGYDLILPKDEFSVSGYLKFAQKIISNIEKRGGLPILVGGTGLYIKGVVDGIPTVDVPRNKKLRENLESLDSDQLYEHLSQIDSFKAGSMNSSDKKNPRRLIRAIEVATWMIDNSKKDLPQNRKTFDTLFVGLTAPSEFLEERINKRVDERIGKGFEGEVKKLIDSGVDWNDQSMMSLGYRQWRDFAEGAIDKETAISEWKKEERKYARRQLVWWKRDGRVHWFDIREPQYQKKVEKLVEKWYTVNYAKEN
jgi:tRNA dimethylallyltransferase